MEKLMVVLKGVHGGAAAGRSWCHEAVVGRRLGKRKKQERMDVLRFSGDGWPKSVMRPAKMVNGGLVAGN
jgi:hypothetical protein